MPSSRKVGALLGEGVDAGLGLLKEIAPAALSASSARESGFVTFDTLYDTCVARQTLHDAHWHDVASGMTRHDPAPPASVVWGNLSVKFNERRRGELWAVAVAFVIIFTWMVPTMLLATLASLDRLRMFFPGPFMTGVLDSPVIAAFISGTLPSILLIVTMSALPYILRFAVQILPVAPPSEIEIRNWVIGRYYLFLLVNVFLVSTISESIWKSLETWLRNPEQISTILANSLPSTAPFFVSYILLKAGSFSLQLCRLSHVVSYLWYSAGTLTPRERRAALGLHRNATDMVDDVFMYETVFPSAMLVFLLTATYAVIQPLVIFAGAFAFAVGWASFRYITLYHYYPLHESGGAMWPLVADWTFGALLISQVVTIGLFSLKRATIVQMTLLVALPIGSVVLYWTYAPLLKARARSLPTRAAIEADLERRLAGSD
jgi:hypothetical protein